MYNTKNIHAHNGRIPDTPVLHSNDEFSGCNVNNSGNAPTSVKPAPPLPKQSTTSVLRQWRRPDTAAGDSGAPKHVPSTRYAKLPADNPGYSNNLDSPAEYSMYNHHQPNRSYLSHVQQYADSTGYNGASPRQPPKQQDARVPDTVLKYSSTGQYYAQETSQESQYRAGTYPGQSTPPLAHAASAKVAANYSEGQNYGPANQKLSPNFHYPISYHQKLQQHDPKSTSQSMFDEPNSYCLKSGAYPAQNRVPQHGLAHPNVPYSLQNQLERRQSPQESSQSYYVNKSACLSQELRHGRQPYGPVYAQTYLAQKTPGPQEQKSREYRQIVQSPSKKSPPFPILEQRLSNAEGSFYPEYGAGAYAHHKYGPGKSYLNTSGPKFPPEDIIPSTYAKYYSQSKVAYEPNHYLLQMNQMQTRLNPNLFARSTELPRDVGYMDQTPRGMQKNRIQYNVVEPSQFGAKSSNVAVQKPAKIVSYGNVQAQRLVEHPPGEYFRNYPKPQSVIQSSKMIVDSYNIPGRTEIGNEPQSYAYSPPLIHQSSRPALAQYPTNYRPSPKINEVGSGNISPRRTFQENMPVVVIPPQCIGLPKVSPPQYSLPGQEYPQMYQNYLPKDSYCQGTNTKPGTGQYRTDQVAKQPVHVSRNVQVQSARVLPAYPSSQYQQTSPDGPEKLYYPPRSIYNQQVVQPAYSAPDYRGYEAAGVVRSAYAKKEVDIGKSLKEYLESWEDDEEIVTNLPDVVLCNNIPAEKQKHVTFAEPIAEAKSVSSGEKPPEDETASQALYILDSTNISSEALSQYLHIQQIDHLPANIKGYYKLPGVGGPLETPAEASEKTSRPAADQKSQNSKEQQLKSTEIKGDLQTRTSQGLGRVAEKAEKLPERPETQKVTCELTKMDPKRMICAQDYSKTRELNILEVPELRIPEISTELAEPAPENASPQDYSVQKRGAAEISPSADAKMTENCKESHFQNCLPQDFSITRKSDAETTPHAAEVTVPQDYSINKQNGPDRLLLAEAGHLSTSENTTETADIPPNTPEDYSESLQEDVALNLSTNRSKFEDDSDDCHFLQETLREADSSIIEESTKTSSASRIQGAVPQGSIEEHLECAGLHDDDKVSSSNTKSLHANKFSSKPNKDSLDEATSVEATVVMEEYMEIQHGDLQKRDAKLEVTKPPAMIQMHTASVIVQNTFFDDKASSKTLLEPIKPPSVPSSTPQILQTFHQQLVNDRSSSESDSDSQKQLKSRSGITRDRHNHEEVAEVCSESIITIAEDDSSSNSSLAPDEMSSPPSDPPGSVPTTTLDYNSESVDSVSADKRSYQAAEQSDLETAVKKCRKQSLLEGYKLKMDETSSGQSNSECEEDEEDDYTSQMTANEEICKNRNDTGDSEDQELLTSDNSDGEVDEERAEDSATEAANTSKIKNSTNEETKLDQSTTEEPHIHGETRQGTADKMQTSQSTTTEDSTDVPAPTTEEVKSTAGQDETSQSTIEECNLESGTVIDEKTCQESTEERSTIRTEEWDDDIQESTVKLDELRESTTSEEGTTSGDESLGTTDEESTIIRREDDKEIGTTQSVLHQSTDTVVQGTKSTSTSHNQAVLEDAIVETTEESLKDQDQDNSALAQKIVQEIADNSTVLDENCKNLAGSNKSGQEPDQECKKVATSNNSAESLQELTVCQCKKVATSNNSTEPLQEFIVCQCKKVATSNTTAQASVQEHSAASRRCNKLATRNNAQENSGEDVVLHQECKTNQIIERNDDNQVIISVDNREATSGSQPWSADEAQSEDSASEEDHYLQTNTEEYEDTTLQSQDTKLIFDKEEINNKSIQFEETHREYEAKDIRMSTGEDSGAVLQFEDADLQFEDTNSVVHREDVLGLEELRDVSVQSEDVLLQCEDPALESEDTLLNTCTTEAEHSLEDSPEDASKIAEENVPELKKPMSLRDSEDDSCEANESALEDLSIASTKSEEFLIENDEDTSVSKQTEEETMPADSFERELEDIFKNIPKDPIVPGLQVPGTSHSELACCLETTIQNRIQPETLASSTDSLKQQEFQLRTLAETELPLETDNSGRIKRETSGKPSTSLEEHSSVQELCGTVAMSQDELPGRDLSSADDEMPEDLVQATIASLPEVASPGDILAGDECLVIYSAADDFVILEEPETVFAETDVQEDDRIAGDAEELICDHEAVDAQMPQADPMVEQIVEESDEHVQELEDILVPAMDDEAVPGQEIIARCVEPDDQQLKLVMVDAEELFESQEPSENQTNDPVKSEDLLTAESQQTYHELHMTEDDVKSDQADAELHLVSEIEVVKHEIKEESPTEPEQKLEDMGTVEEFEIDVKEEIVTVEEQVPVEDDTVEDSLDNVDLKEEVLDCEKNVEDQLVSKEDDEKPEELVQEELRPTEAISDEKMEDISQKTDKEGRIREELEEGELSDQSETEEAQELKPQDVVVIDDWDEPEELLDAIQLPVPVSQEKKLLFARRKKNLEKLKAKFLSVKPAQLASKPPSLNQIQTSAVIITEEVIQPGIFRSKPPEVHSPKVPKPESNNNRRGVPEYKSTSVKYTGRRTSMNSAPSLQDVDEDAVTNSSVNSTKLSRNLAKLSSNCSFDSDDELFPFPTSKPSTAQNTSSVSSKASSASLGNKSASRKSTRPPADLPQCPSADTCSKSDLGGSTAEDAFQLPRVSPSVEDKELFINPENPRYQPPAARGFDARKRSQSYTDYSGLKIEFTAPRRRYSAMEAARPVRKPIINLDEISQNITEVLERLDSTEKQRYDDKATYNQRKQTVECMERGKNETKLVTESQNQFNLAHTDIFYSPKPKLQSDNLEPKQGARKLDHFKVFEKMTQRKSVKLLPVNLYDDEESVLKDISGQKVADSKSIREEPAATSVWGAAESPEELDQRMDSSQRLNTDKIPTLSLLEDHKITSPSIHHKETPSTRVSKAQEQVDSAHHMPKRQHSNALTAVEPSTQELTRPHQLVKIGADPEGVASSHQLVDPLVDVPSTLVDPILVLPKVSYNPRTKKLCGVRNGQTKQRKLCKSASQSEKSTERRSSNEKREEKLAEDQMKLEENKEGKSNVPQAKEDNETLKNQIEKTASQAEGQPKMLGNKDGSRLKQKGRTEDSQAKMKRDEGRQKMETSKRDNQKLEANKEDAQKPRDTDKDCPIDFKGREEDEMKIQGTREHGQIKRIEEENQLTIKTRTLHSDILRSGDDMVRNTIPKTSTNVPEALDVDTSTARSSTTLLDSSSHKQVDSTNMVASSSSKEALLSSAQSTSSNTEEVTPNGRINIKPSATNIKVELPKPQSGSSNAKRGRPDRQRTSANVKSGKLNAIIAKLGSANLQAVNTLKTQASRASNVIASESLTSVADRLSTTTQKTEDGLISPVNQPSSVESPAGSRAATVGQPSALEEHASSVRKDSSKLPAVSAPMHYPPPSLEASSSTSFSVLVEPAGPRRKASDPRTDRLPAEVKTSEGIENKLSNTFRLTEYTKSYIQLKMSQEMDRTIANGLRQSDPRLGEKPIQSGAQQVKRKLPNSDLETSVTGGQDKKVKINLQDYRNRKQHLVGPPGDAKIDHRKDDSFDDCLGEVVNGIGGDLMTVMEATYVANDKSGECLDLSRRSPNLGMQMSDLEIYMDDSMELIPGNEEIVHTSQEEDMVSECLEHSGTEEFDTCNESSSPKNGSETNPTNHPGVGARKMRLRMICKPDAAIDQARFEDASFPGPSTVDDEQNRNAKIPLPKTAAVKRTKETITNHLEPKVTNTAARRRTKSKGEMKMYRPKRRKKRFRNLYTTDEDEESQVPTVLARNAAQEMLPNDEKTASVRMQPREETQDNSLASCASPEDYSHLVSIEPAPYKYRSGAKKHLLRLEESQETNSSSSSGDRRQDYQHKRGKSKDDADDDDNSLESQPSSGDRSEAVSRKLLEYKCHINLNALGRRCTVLTSDPLQASSSKMGLKLTLKSVRKEQPPAAAFGEVLGCLDASPSGESVARRGKHGKRKVPRKEPSGAYSVSTSSSAANCRGGGWTVNDKIPKVIIKRNGSGYCAVSRDVSTNPIWQPMIRVRRHRYIESLVSRGTTGDSAP